MSCAHRSTPLELLPTNVEESVTGLLTVPSLSSDAATSFALISDRTAAKSWYSISCKPSTVRILGGALVSSSSSLGGLYSSECSCAFSVGSCSELTAPAAASCRLRSRRCRQTKKTIAARIVIAPTVEPTAMPAIAAVLMSVSAAGGVGLGVWVMTGLEGDVEDALDVLDALDALDVLDVLDAMHD